jgi:hypothetical protein
VDEETALALVEKKGHKLTQVEEKLRLQAVKSGKLVSKYGKIAVVAFSARRIRSSDVENILRKELILGNRFYELVLEAERKALSKRFRY